MPNYSQDNLIYASKNEPHFFPFTSDQTGILAAFIREKWKRAEQECEVNLRFVRDAMEVAAVDRGNMALYGAYDPSLSFAVSHYGFIASAQDIDVATFGVAIYELGDRDLAEYLEEVGLYDGADPVILKGDAKLLATGCRGTAAFGGNAWVHREYRQSGLMVTMAEISRAISLAMFNCDHTFMFMRASLAERGFRSNAQEFRPGAWWGGEERWLGYTRKRSIIMTSLDMSRHDAQYPASTH